MQLDTRAGGRAVARALLCSPVRGSAAFASKGLDAAIADAVSREHVDRLDKRRARSSTPDDDGDGDALEPAKPPPIDY
jgi:hypothetical protein